MSWHHSSWTEQYTVRLPSARADVETTIATNMASDAKKTLAADVMKSSL
jgi:hypothetical protein